MSPQYVTRVFLGALSVVPILLYMSFLFLLTRADLLPLIMPNSFRTVFQFTIFSLMPPAAMSNELGSLLGVAYRVRQTPSGAITEIGFNSSYSKTLSLAFTISTIVLLGTFQLFIFLLCTWHISRAWDQPSPLFDATSRPSINRNRSNSYTSNSYLGDEQGVRGLSWLALALCLGAAETFVAFAPQGFVSTLVRRILRILSRGVLLYSLVRGSSDGFSNLEEGTTVMPDGGIRAGGIRALISNPRFSTFAQLTPNATAFYGMSRATSGPVRPNKSTPHGAPSFTSEASQTRVTVMYDQKSAPILQMRFSGLDVPDSSKFTTRSIRSASIISRRTSIAGHGGHSTNAATPARSRTLSEKRSGTRLASITIPDTAVLAGVTATQSAASSMTSLPPLPPQPPRESPPRPTGLQIGSLQRSSTRSSTSVNDSLEGVRDLSTQFPGLPPRVRQRGPTQLAYAVEEESEPPSSRQHSREHVLTHTRTDTEDSVTSVLSSASRRKPVPPHTPRGTIIVPSDQERRPSIPKTNSGEEVVVEAHSALFPETADPMVDYVPGSPQSSARSSSLSDLTTTVIATASPEQLRKPGRLAERVETSEAMRREVERNWMRRSRPDIVIPAATSQNMVISRTPEISAVGDDYMSARAVLEGNMSPRSPWSATVPYAPMQPPSPGAGRSTLAFPRAVPPSRTGTPTRVALSLPGTPPRAALGLPPNPRAGRPGSNVEGWGRKLSDGQEGVPTLSGLAAEEKVLGEASGRWQESEVLGRYEGEFVRRSLASYRPPSTSSDPFAGDGPHAI
ncbi:hypothetical protein RhiJN_13085 [Ceratobasidium sp. AG-Ba]|nr:hypothetical protein RhiJN_13085 [Ceratobasidium sp. AG-Ba]QRW13646.1 hypothetical protein RhiLY_12645 [Ceratobasidium sp. AG-Ba]